MDIGDLLDRAAVAPRVGASDKRHALLLAADVGARVTGLPAQRLFDALMRREAQGSTGIGSSVAVPHAHVEGLQRVRGVFLRLDHPIEFDAVDDQPVDLIFALLSPEGAAAEHLRALARVTRMLRKPELRRDLRRAQSIDTVHALLSQEAQQSAA